MHPTITRMQEVVAKGEEEAILELLAEDVTFLPPTYWKTWTGRTPVAAVLGHHGGSSTGAPAHGSVLGAGGRGVLVPSQERTLDQVMAPSRGVTVEVDRAHAGRWRHQNLRLHRHLLLRYRSTWAALQMTSPR